MGLGGSRVGVELFLLFGAMCYGCLGLWVLLCVLLVFGSCLGSLVWAHGFRMLDGFVLCFGLWET